MDNLFTPGHTDIFTWYAERYLTTPLSTFLLSSMRSAFDMSGV